MKISYNPAQNSAPLVINSSRPLHHCRGHGRFELLGLATLFAFGHLLHRGRIILCGCREGRFPEQALWETSVGEDSTFSFGQQPLETEAKTVSPWMETVKQLVPTALTGKVAR